MKKCYNKRCENFDIRLDNNCKYAIYPEGFCGEFKEGKTKAEILKMAYDVVVQEEDLIFEIDNLENWSFRCFRRCQVCDNSGKGFESLYKKCKELLNDK